MDLGTAAAVGAAIGAITPTGARRDFTPRDLFGRGRTHGTRSHSRKVSNRVRKKAKTAKEFFKHERSMYAAPAGFDTCKRDETVDPTSSDSDTGGILVMGTQSMRVREVTSLTKSGFINSRERDSVFLSGVRVNFHVVFRHDGIDVAQLNWALVSPKNSSTMTSADTNMFRDYGPARGWNASAANKSGLQWCTAKVNLDDYLIFGKGKVTLNSRTIVQYLDASAGEIYRSANNNNENHFAMVDQYVPIGRTITFNGTACNERVYLIFYGGRPAMAAGNYNDLNNPFDITCQCITYFREPEKIG